MDDEPEPMTVDEANRSIDLCKRNPCSDCPPRGHHWYSDSIDPDDAEAVTMFVVEHPQAAAKAKSRAFLLAHCTCKHCPAVKRWAGEEI